jgi:hypothetical protein
MTTSALTLPVSSVALATILATKADTAAMMLAIHRDAIPSSIRADIDALIKGAETLSTQITTAEAYRVLGEELDETERTIRGTMGRGLGGMVLIAELRAAHARLGAEGITAESVAATRATVATARTQTRSLAHA